MSGVSTQEDVNNLEKISGFPVHQTSARDHWRILKADGQVLENNIGSRTRLEARIAELVARGIAP